MIETSEQVTVGEIVAADFRTAGIFERYGIDFCCGGQRSFNDACQAAGADPQIVRGALDALPPRSSDEDDVTKWSLERLVDHIESTHHQYVRSALPTITRYLHKLVDVHGSRHPELVQMAATFDTLRDELLQHMMKEEYVLFPYLRELEATAGRARTPCPFGSVENPIRMMEREHAEAGDGMKLIRELTHGYQPPDDGCTTYRVCMESLAEFERDLHRHVHLENNILFPKAVERERGRIE